MTFFNQDFLQFFMDLAGNNNKDWFDQNRKRYEVNVKDAFKNFVTHIITKLAEEDPAFKDLEASSCIFRINRDIRFSKDKTPYKMNVSAVVAPEGKKSKAINGVYFELGPEHVRVYGGVYEIDKDDLLTVREGIAKNPEKFKKLYSEESFKNVFGEILGEKNKVIPKELKGESYFEILKLPILDYSIHLDYQVEETKKKVITEYYLFKLASQFFYSKDFDRSKRCIKALEKLKTEKFKKDIRYFKRKMFFSWFRF